MMKAQLREGRRVVRLEIERLKKLWRDDRLERQTSRQKQITFKAWLQLTGKGDEFLFLEVQNKEFADLLGCNNDAFSIDTTGQRYQHVEEVIQRALTKPHILEQMSQCSWGAGTNSSIDITMGPFNDDNDHNKATQEETQEKTQDHTQETIFDLTGDISIEDDSHSRPPSSPTLPLLKTPSKKPFISRYKKIKIMLKDFKKTRNS